MCFYFIISTLWRSVDFGWHSNTSGIHPPFHSPARPLSCSAQSMFLGELFHRQFKPWMVEWSFNIPGTGRCTKHYSDQLEDLSPPVSERLGTQMEIQLTDDSDAFVWPNSNEPGSASPPPWMCCYSKIQMATETAINLCQGVSLAVLAFSSRLSCVMSVQHHPKSNWEKTSGRW